MFTTVHKCIIGIGHLNNLCPLWESLTAMYPKGEWVFVGNLIDLNTVLYNASFPTPFSDNGKHGIRYCLVRVLTAVRRSYILGIFQLAMTCVILFPTVVKGTTAFVAYAAMLGICYGMYLSVYHTAILPCRKNSHPVYKYH